MIPAASLGGSLLGLADSQAAAWRPRGLGAPLAAVMRGDGFALIAAIDEALAAQPDVLEKIRDGKVQAAGALIGAVMKAMAGKADAARVRELVVERAQG